MPTITECSCCLEAEVVRQLLEAIDIDDEVNQYTGEVTCVTEHPGFPSVCLSRYTLDASRYQYEQQYGNFEAHSNR